MTIEEAIDILSDCCDRHILNITPDFYAAVQMGKDALVLNRQMREAQE
ncbi:hypothetical protein ES705_14106 [subsurface metagenome]